MTHFIIIRDSALAKSIITGYNNKAEAENQFIEEALFYAKRENIQVNLIEARNLEHLKLGYGRFFIGTYSIRKKPKRKKIRAIPLAPKQEKDVREYYEGLFKEHQEFLDDIKKNFGDQMVVDRVKSIPSIKEKGRK